MTKPLCVGRAAGATPLAVSSYTLGTEVGFEDRVRAAAEAGFDGIGLRAENYWDAQQTGLDDDDLVEIAEGHEIDVLEVEYLTGWGTAADRDQAQQRKEQTVFAMARTFGVRHLNAGLMEKLPLDVVTEAFAGLCDRAGQDLTVALEFIPFSGIPDLNTAWRVLTEADRRNSALLLDAWHWIRAGTTPADLEPVPADRIVAVQLCDVQEHPLPELRAESLGHRLPPGQGYGDPVGMVRALLDKEVRPRVITAEVISDELVAAGVLAAARTAAVASRKVLAEAGVTLAQAP